MESSSARAWLLKRGFSDATHPRAPTTVHAECTHALLQAAHEGNLDMVTWLLMIGGSRDMINVASNHQWTPLLRAISQGHIVVAQMLYNHGADPTHKTHAGWTCMHWAARSGSVEMISWLLNNGAEDLIAEPNDFVKWTPIRIAAEHDHENVCRYLILNGAFDTSKGTSTESIPLQSQLPSHLRSISRGLVVWATNEVADNDNFVSVVLCGRTKVKFVSNSNMSTTSAFDRFLDAEGLPRLVAHFMGFCRGRQLRRLRKFLREFDQKRTEVADMSSQVKSS